MQVMSFGLGPNTEMQGSCKVFVTSQTKWVATNSSDLVAEFIFWRCVIENVHSPLLLLKRKLSDLKPFSEMDGKIAFDSLSRYLIIGIYLAAAAR